MNKPVDKIELALAAYLEGLGDIDRRLLRGFDDCIPLWQPVLELGDVGEEQLYSLGANMDRLPVDRVDVAFTQSLIDNDGVRVEGAPPSFSRYRSVGRAEWLRRGGSVEDLERFYVTQLLVRRRRRPMRLGRATKRRRNGRWKVIRDMCMVARGDDGHWYQYALGDAQTVQHIQLGRRFRVADHLYSALDVGATVAMSATENRFISWRVALSIDGLPSLSFHTDPTGAREIFRLRDIDSKGNRRGPLLHWVRGHARQRRNNPAALTWVRSHCRGKTVFMWEGVRCTIIPALAEFDPEWNGDKELAETENMARIEALAREGVSP
jgi:hypothetical protein